MRSHYLFFIIGVLVFGLSTQALAISQTMTLSGHIAKPDGTALSSSDVSFKFSITNPTATCVIYEESVTSLDLSNSSGNFEASLGTGTLTYPTDGRTLKDVLSNSAAIACSGSGTYTPASTDARSLTIQFIDNTESSPAWRTFTSGIPLNSVPSAFYASSAEKLGTNVASDFVIKTGIPTCTAGQFLTWDGTSLTCNAAAAAGNYMTALTGDVTAAGPGSSAASIAKLQGTTLTLTSPSSGEFLRHNGTAFVNATLSAGDIPSLDWSKISSGKPTTLAGYGITDAVGSGNISVTAPITNSGSASAPVITMPVATTSQNGYLSSSDFTIFNNKLSTTLFSGKIWVGGAANSASPVYPNGDVTMSNSGAFTVQKIQSISVSSSLPTSSGQVLRYDGATQYVPSFIEISDMRSTVAPFNPVFTNAACNADESLHYISATDTFDCQLVSISDGQINYTNVNQKLFFAGPTNSTGTPTFRSIATADINGVAFVNGGNSFGTTTVFGTGDANNLIFATNGTGKMTLDTTGRLGIGYSPRAALDVNGTILSSPAASNATATIDFLTGNLQYTSNSCGAFAFHNLKDGGSYMFVVKGSTSALCSFTAFSDAGTTGLTVHMPPDHATTIAGKHTIYNFAVLGADIYISWTPGY